MNKKILFALPISALAVACAMQAPPEPSRRCQSVDVPPKCMNTTQIVTFNVNSGVIAPPHVCADANTKVKFQIQPSNTPVTVAVVPKVAMMTWPLGTNILQPSEFEVTVPASAISGTYSDYYIVTTNGKCYDPRIHVN